MTGARRSRRPFAGAGWSGWRQWQRWIFREVEAHLAETTDNPASQRVLRAGRVTRGAFLRARGLEVRQIAEQLGESERTVKRDRALLASMAPARIPFDELIGYIADLNLSGEDLPSIPDLPPLPRGDQREGTGSS